MNEIENKVLSEVNLKVLAKNIYEESVQMGFDSSDYIKLTNEILGMTIDNEISKNIPMEKIEKKSTKKIKLPLTTQNLIIRKYSPEKDKEYLSKWFENDISKLFLISNESMKDLNINNILSDDKNIFVTITLKNNHPIGLLAVLSIDKQNKKGEMRKLIGDLEYRGKGYAKEATKIWIDYCINVLDLNKIYINTIDTNIRNISLNRQLGFKIEGLLKNECILDGIEHDVLRMAYFKTE